jgi:hypothetical protein
MRKRDFVAVAAALKVCRDSTHPVSLEDAAHHTAQHDALAHALANVLAGQSRTFNRARFLHESGVNLLSQKLVDTVLIIA